MEENVLRHGSASDLAHSFPPLSPPYGAMIAIRTAEACTQAYLDWQRDCRLPQCTGARKY